LKIPQQILSIFENESSGLLFGQVSITAYFRDGKARFSVDKQQSVQIENEVAESKTSADPILRR